MLVDGKGASRNIQVTVPPDGSTSVTVTAGVVLKAGGHNLRLICHERLGSTVVFTGGAVDAIATESEGRRMSRRAVMGQVYRRGRTR